MAINFVAKEYKVAFIDFFVSLIIFSVLVWDSICHSMLRNPTYLERVLALVVTVLAIVFSLSIPFFVKMFKAYRQTHKEEWLIGVIGTIVFIIYLIGANYAIFPIPRFSISTDFLWAYISYFLSLLFYSLSWNSLKLNFKAKNWLRLILHSLICIGSALFFIVIIVAVIYLE